MEHEQQFIREKLDKRYERLLKESANQAVLIQELFEEKQLREKERTKENKVKDEELVELRSKAERLTNAMHEHL